MRRGGRSSLGRRSVWPPTRLALLYLSLGAMVVGAAIAAFSNPTVGLRVFFGGVLVQCAVHLYDLRWQRLQGELFRRRG